MFAPWVPIQYNNPEPGARKQIIPGTGCWSKELTEPGVFHQWGVESDGGDPPSNDTMAVIEDSTGAVKLVPPTLIKFTDPIKL